MERNLALATDQPPGESFDDLVRTDSNINDTIHAPSALGQQFLQGLRLLKGPRKAVKQDSRRGLLGISGKVFPEHLHRGCIGNEFTTTHILPGNPSQFGWDL